MKQQGFTIIELVMVIVLVGILSTFAATQFDLSGYENQEAAVELVEAIRYAQAQAMAHSGADSDGDGNFDRYRINFDGTANTYTIVRDDSNSTNLGNVSNPTNGSTSYTQSWSTGVNISPSVSSLSFNSRGDPVGLAGAATIIINGDITLTIQPLTGYVSR